MPENWTVLKILNWSYEYLEKQGIDSPKITSQLLLSNVLSISRFDLFVKHDYLLNSIELNKYKEFIVRRINHEPTEYILGNAEFLGISFQVSPDVLIPRPETEELVQVVLDYIENMNDVVVVDIGTGSGAIACAIKHNYPYIDVFATDISKSALSVARNNAKNLGLSINFVNDFCVELDAFKKVVIVSNPPYIKSKDILSLDPEVKDFEPMLALDGGNHGLDVISKIINLPKKNSQIQAIIIEVGYDQKNIIEELLDSVEYEWKKDFQGINRFIKIQY